MELAMLLQVPLFRKEKPPPLGLEKGGKSRILRFAKQALAGGTGVATVPFLWPHPLWPQHPLTPHVPGSAVRRKSQMKCFA